MELIQCMNFGVHGSSRGSWLGLVVVTGNCTCFYLKQVKNVPAHARGAGAK